MPTALTRKLLAGLAPPAQSEFLARTIPGARLIKVEGEGHLCIFDHWSEILASALE